MSDRDFRVICLAWLNLIFVTVVVLIAGCERTGTVSQPRVEAPVAADSKPAPNEPANAVTEAPLLLLEDEAENGAPSDSAADNSRCFVCHINYMQEKLAVTHARAGIGCAQCHGPSDAHIADESWASGGNGTAPAVMYPRDKVNPACMTCHAREKLETPEHRPLLAGSTDKVCTDCHGKHRLPQRRCKWK
jgi:hypothetical protein